MDAQPASDTAVANAVRRNNRDLACMYPPYRFPYAQRPGQATAESPTESVKLALILLPYVPSYLANSSRTSDKTLGSTLNSSCPSFRVPSSACFLAAVEVSGPCVVAPPNGRRVTRVPDAIRRTALLPCFLGVPAALRPPQRSVHVPRRKLAQTVPVADSSWS